MRDVQPRSTAAPRHVDGAILSERLCVHCGKDFRPGELAQEASRVAGGPVYQHVRCE